MKRMIPVFALVLLMIFYSVLFHDSFYRVVSVKISMDQYYITLKILGGVILTGSYYLIVMQMCKHQKHNAKPGIWLAQWLFALCLLILYLQSGFDLSMSPILIAVIINVVYILKSNYTFRISSGRSSAVQIVIPIAILILIVIGFGYFEVKDYVNTMIVEGNIEYLRHTSYGIDKLIFYLVGCTLSALCIYLFKSYIVSYVTLYLLGIPFIFAVDEVERSLVILASVNTSTGVSQVLYNIASHLGIVFVILTCFILCTYKIHSSNDSTHSIPTPPA